MNLNLLLFGATRNTGYSFMQQALAAGHTVTAVVRNPAAFTYTHANLKVVKGDALQLQTFQHLVPGHHAIISTLGITPDEVKQPVILCQQGVQNMITAMQKTDTKRIICISALPLDYNFKMGPIIMLAGMVLNSLFKNAYNDLRGMEAHVKASNLQWTIVRPPQLKDKPVTGRYRAAIGGHLWLPFSIGRPDLAHFILQHLTDPATYNKTVEIAY